MKLTKATHAITSIAANSNRAVLPPPGRSLEPLEPRAAELAGGGRRILEGTAGTTADARRDRVRAAFETLRSKGLPPSLHPALRGGAVGGRRRLGFCALAAVFAMGAVAASFFYFNGCLGGTMGVLECPSRDRQLVRLLEGGDGGDDAQVLVDTFVAAFDDLVEEDQLRTLECDAEVFEAMSAEERERLVVAEARVADGIIVDDSPVAKLVGGDNIFDAGPWTDEELAAAMELEELLAGEFDGRRSLSAAAVDPDAVWSMKEAIVDFTTVWDGMDEEERAELASGVVEGVELYANSVW